MKAISSSPAFGGRRGALRDAGWCIVLAFGASAIFFSCLFPGSLCAAEPGDAELLVRPAALDAGEVYDLDDGKRLLLRQSILERSLEGGSNYQQLRQLIGADRCRELSRAQFMLDLYAEHLGRDPRDDPRFEDARDAVFGAWKKIQRERLEEALGIEAWWNKKRSGYRGLRSGSEPGDEARNSERDAWSLRVSPRLSDDAVGVKLRLKGTDSYLDHMTFRFSYEVDESHPVFMLKFEDNLRFFDLYYAPDTLKYGDQLGVSLRYSW